jgi:hypothetical protein
MTTFGDHLDRLATGDAGPHIVIILNVFVLIVLARCSVLEVSDGRVELPGGYFLLVGIVRGGVGEISIVDMSIDDVGAARTFKQGLYLVERARRWSACGRLEPMAVRIGLGPTPLFIDTLTPEELLNRCGDSGGMCVCRYPERFPKTLSSQPLLDRLCTLAKCQPVRNNSRGFEVVHLDAKIGQSIWKGKVKLTDSRPTPADSGNTDNCLLLFAD